MPKKILVAPLDWGLGHATRSIPVIKEFLNQGCEVQIASSGDALVLLKQEFSNLKFHELVSYRAAYSSWMPFMLKILIQLPKFFIAIKKEHRQTERIVETEKIDFVISDNRFGCWSKQAHSIIITHQLNILMNSSWKWLEGIINFGNHNQIKKFNECWVPDFQNGVTGKLTSLRATAKQSSNSWRLLRSFLPRNDENLNLKYIGMVSRFKRRNLSKKFNVLFLLSGPEPQRSVFESMIKSQIQNLDLNYFIVRGKPSQQNENTPREANHLSANELNDLIESSDLIISRSGYTTIMDLSVLKKNSVFIPTPGQTEQEYLAEELMSRKIIFSQKQSEFDLKKALKECKNYSGFEGDHYSINLLAEAVKKLVS